MGGCKSTVVRQLNIVVSCQGWEMKSKYDEEEEQRQGSEPTLHKLARLAPFQTR